MGSSDRFPVIYMIHNKTAQPMVAYIQLNIVFMHGSPDELNAPGKRPVHDIRGMLMGRTAAWVVVAVGLTTRSARTVRGYAAPPAGPAAATPPLRGGCARR